MTTASYPLGILSRSQHRLHQATETIRLPPSTTNPMIPEPYEPFDSNRKEDTIFLLGSIFIVTFLLLL